MIVAQEEEADKYTSKIKRFKMQLTPLVTNLLNLLLAVIGSPTGPDFAEEKLIKTPVCSRGTHLLEGESHLPCPISPAIIPQRSLRKNDAHSNRSPSQRAVPDICCRHRTAPFCAGGSERHHGGASPLFEVDWRDAFVYTPQFPQQTRRFYGE